MFDNAYASLLEDLASRGMLDNTLVVAMGEFGRTPKINPAGGRDHWPQCWDDVDGRRRREGWPGGWVRPMNSAHIRRIARCPRQPWPRR